MEKERAGAGEELYSAAVVGSLLYSPLIAQCCTSCESLVLKLYQKKAERACGCFGGKTLNYPQALFAFKLDDAAYDYFH